MSESVTDTAVAEASDAALIARIRAGEHAAYGTLYERHLDAARGLARHLIGGDAAEDAVQETFAKILDVLQRGGGPQEGFRPYLLTSVRRTVYDRYRGEKRLHTTDEIEVFDPGVPFEDPALAGLERSMIVRAFRALPERWQAVLWHTEIEGARPAEVAPLLGLTANGVAALAYRAREGLRQAYLQMHLAEPDAPIGSGAAVPPATDRCRPVLDKLGAYVRDGLARRDARSVERHLDDCARCKAIYAEIADVNGTLREGLGPLVLGAAAAAYLAAAKGGGLAAGGGVLGWFRHLPKRQQQATAGAAAAVLVGLLAGGMVLASTGEPLKPRPKPPAAAPAAPAPAPPAKPGAPGGKPKPKPPAKAAPKPKPKPAPGASTPKPAAAPAAQPPAKMTARIGTVGTLLRQQPGIVAMTVRNDGGSPSKDVLAIVDLPPDVAYAGGATGRNSVMFTPLRPPGDGWACRPGAGGTVRCTHAPLPARSATSAYLDVRVGAAAPYDTPPAVTLRAGGAPLTARAEEGVAADGMPARFAADGHVRAVQTGNALLGCDTADAGCRRAMDREGDERDDDFWDMTPIDRDDDKGTSSSSAATLDVPAGGKVLWAGLYWSGVADGDVPATAKLRGPGGAYQAVKAAETRRGRLPDFGVYQAFADVTEQVRAAGGGTWWGADVPTVPGTAHYAGWALVAVVEDPKAPFQQAMVLDDARALGPQAGDRLEARVNGLLTAARPARIGLVAWEGDAGLTGDRFSLDGRALTPETGDRSADNVLDSAADGAIGPKLTFGIDVDYFSVTLGRHPVLSLSTGRDALFAGVVTVTAPMRS